MLRLDLRSNNLVILVESEIVVLSSGASMTRNEVRTEGTWSRSKGLVRVELNRRTFLNGKPVPEGYVPVLDLKFEGNDLVETDSTGDRFVRQN